MVLPIKDTVNKRTLNFYRKISKSHRSSVYYKVLQIAKDENLPMVDRANKLQEKYGLNAESRAEDWNKELQTAVKETQETTKHQTIISKEDMRTLPKCQLIPRTGQSKGLSPIQQAG